MQGALAILCSLPVCDDSGTAFAEEPKGAADLPQPTGLPEYQAQKLGGVKLSSVGSDSMGGLIRLWVEEYRKYQPEATMQIVSRGSAMAPSALIEGTADLGPMARPMKTAEREEFISKYGFEPTQIRTALAAVAVYVNEQNPIEKITFNELDRVYSADVRRADAAPAATWGDLGVSGEFAANEIHPIGREPKSYVSFYFRQRVLLQGDFSPALMTTADLPSIFEAVSINPGALAFGELERRPVAGVKILPVAKDEGEKAYLPTEDTVVDGTYPLSRYLNIYVVRTPGEPLESSVTDFLRFVLSRQGQQLVSREGMIPLPPEVVQEELAKLK